MKNELDCCDVPGHDEPIGPVGPDGTTGISTGNKTSEPRSSDSFIIAGVLIFAIITLILIAVGYDSNSKMDDSKWFYWFGAFGCGYAVYDLVLLGVKNARDYE